MRLYIISLFTLLLNLSLYAQVDLGYQQPSADILKLVDTPLPPLMRMNDNGTTAVLLYRSQFKGIAELSQPELRLGGLRINPKKNIGSRVRFYNDIKILDITTGRKQSIDGMPADAQLAYLSWSPNQSKIAFINAAAEQVELYVYDLKANQLEHLANVALNANMGNPIIWLKDSKSLIAQVLPAKPDLIDKSMSVPTGPVISENDGKKAQNRTYQDLLKDKADEHNFEELAQSTLLKISLGESMAVSEWMPASIYRSMEPSPDGNYMLVTTVEKPFSYLVPYYRFPSKTAVYSSDGVHVKTILQVPLIEDLPKGFMAVRTGKRNIDWRDDKAATLTWVEALDGGDPAQEIEYRDALYEQAAPFTGEAHELLKVKNRFVGIDWGNEEFALAYDRWFNDRNTKTYFFNPSDPDAKSIIIADRNYQDRYSDPGEFVTEKSKFQTNVVALNDGKIYTIGDGYSDGGIYPFVDEHDLKNFETKRLYQASDKNKRERIISAIDVKEGKFLTRLESKSDYPNYYERNLYKKMSPKAITDFTNPFESLSKVQKEVISYKRDDGVDLSATLYLPADYDKSSGEKLPMILWAYPVEYKDKSSAGQVTSSENDFIYPSYGSVIFWVTKGYAVLDRTAFPIIGEEDAEPNDSFRKQLVANAKAAIDAVDDMGCIDRDRVGVGGHSYGAFMTANLLSHSDLFAAGIARSGAYNRTLTPFGFQREERSYWDDPEIYYNMSPFMHADKMKTPLLLIHGQADNNSGTYPMQSERYFNALKGLGATVRLVMLPKESHGYSARESVLHMLWEQEQWLDKYVKNREDVKEKDELRP